MADPCHHVNGGGPRSVGGDSNLSSPKPSFSHAATHPTSSHFQTAQLHSMGTPLEDIGSKQMTPDLLQTMLSFLRKNGLAETEESLTREAMALLKADPGAPTDLSAEDTVVTEFESLVKHVESCVDVIQAEFSQLLFPIFAHSYFSLIEIQAPNAFSFFNRFKSYMPECYAEYVFYLSKVVDNLTLSGNTYAQTLKKNPFVVRMSKTCIKQLELPLSRMNNIKSIIKDHIVIEQTEITTKLRTTVEMQMGGLLGQVSKNERRYKMLYGVVKDDLMQAIERRKMKGKEWRDNSKKMQQVAPQPDRIPMPPLSEYVREDKRQHLREVSKMTNVSPDSPVSICMYTTLNAPIGVSACAFSDDSNLIAIGLSDSSILVNAMDPNNKIKKLRAIEQLEKIDLETSENVVEQMYDPNAMLPSAQFYGHGATVFAVDFSPDRRLLMSTGGDKTVRMWSMDVQKNVVIYRTPSVVWDTKFCNRGYYFCTGSQDKTAAVWCTDRMQPIRMFADSFSDVGCVDFHSNCNYVAGGSDDRYVRVWDVLAGTCVRTFGGHKGVVRSVKFSPDGRYLVSLDAVGNICVWDLAYQRLCAVEMTEVRGTMASIAFTRDGGSFAVSHGTSAISLYSLDHLISAMTANAHNDISFDPKVNMEGFNFGTYPTKQTPVLGLHFTRRNLLMAFGCYGLQT